MMPGRWVPRFWAISTHVAATGIRTGPYASPKKAPKTTTAAIVPLRPTSPVTGVDGRRAMMVKTATPASVGSRSTAATTLINVADVVGGSRSVTLAMRPLCGELVSVGENPTPVVRHGSEHSTDLPCMDTGRFFAVLIAA